MGALEPPHGGAIRRAERPRGKEGIPCDQDVHAFVAGLDASPLDTVVLDNASIHGGAERQTRAAVLRTPPYCPEYNAIELCFARVKRAFRDANASAARRAPVPDMIEAAVASLRPATIVACFRHVDEMVRADRHDRPVVD